MLEKMEAWQDTGSEGGNPLGDIGRSADRLSLGDVGQNAN